MLGRLETIVRSGKTLDIVEGLTFTVDRVGVKQYIISLNTFEQLFDQGIDSEGVKLSSIGGPYSNYTVRLKRAAGLPADRVTLYNTGTFYESFRVEIKNGDIIIDSNPIKDGESLFDRYGDNVEGLTDDSIELLGNRILPELIKWLTEKILES